MSFVILSSDGRIIRPRPYAPNFKSIGAAKVSAAVMVKKGRLEAGGYSVVPFDAVPPKAVRVKSLMSGAWVLEDINTPYSCSVASEAYWSN